MEETGIKSIRVKGHSKVVGTDTRIDPTPVTSY